MKLTNLLVSPFVAALALSMTGAALPPAENNNQVTKPISVERVAVDAVSVPADVKLDFTRVGVKSQPNPEILKAIKAKEKAAEAKKKAAVEKKKAEAAAKKQAAADAKAAKVAAAKAAKEAEAQQQAEYEAIAAEEAAVAQQVQQEAQAPQQMQYVQSAPQAAPAKASAAPAAKKAKSSNASGVVGIAASYVGTPYVWGGNTPSGWDCSGYVQYVFGKAGVSLPRTNQWVGRTKISQSAAKPGDLVVQNGGSHVGIYAGNGMMYSALNPAEGTKLHPVAWMPAEFYAM